MQNKKYNLTKEENECQLNEKILLINIGKKDLITKSNNGNNQFTNKSIIENLDNKLLSNGFKIQDKTNKDKNSKISKDKLFLYLNIISIFYLIIYIIYSLKIKRNQSNEKDSDIKSKIYDKIFSKEEYNKTLDEIIKMKKVVYTINMGKYDNIQNISKQEGWDYFCFIDSKTKKYNYSNWTVVQIPEELKNMNISFFKKTRYIKIRPHLYFKNYSLSLYIDSTFSIKGDLNEFVLRIITPNYNIFIYEHPFRGDIYDEIQAVVDCKKEKSSKAEKILQRYKEENFPKNYGLTENCLILRRHNEKDCIYLMDRWWEEIKKNSYRDQISFNYLLWKTGIKIKVISKYYSFKYFKIATDHLKKIEFK